MKIPKHNPNFPMVEQFNRTNEDCRICCRCLLLPHRPSTRLKCRSVTRRKWADGYNLCSFHHKWTVPAKHGTLAKKCDHTSEKLFDHLHCHEIDDVVNMALSIPKSAAFDSDGCHLEKIVNWMQLCQRPVLPSKICFLWKSNWNAWLAL